MHLSTSLLLPANHKSPPQKPRKCSFKSSTSKMHHLDYSTIPGPGYCGEFDDACHESRSRFNHGPTVQSNGPTKIQTKVAISRGCPSSSYSTLSWHYHFPTRLQLLPRKPKKAVETPKGPPSISTILHQSTRFYIYDLARKDPRAIRLMRRIRWQRKPRNGYHYSYYRPLRLF